MLSKILKSFNLEKLCALYVILWIFVPPVQVGTIYRVLAVGCAGLWFLCVLFRDSKTFTFLGKYLFIGGLCAVLMIVWAFGSYSIGDAVVHHLQFIIMLVCGAIATYYMNTDREFVRIMIGVCLLVISFFCITTMQGVLENPYAARIANSEWLEGRFEQNKNVGLYGYVYMCVLIAPMLLYKMVKKIKINRFMDTVTFIAFILILGMGILSGYMIANLCLLLGCGLVIILHKTSIARIMVFAVLIFAFIIFYKDIVAAFFDLFSNLLGDNPAYGQKIREFRALFLEGNTAGVTVDERFSNYQVSFARIVQYPIIGSLLFGVVGGGGHSTVLDTIGKYGWLIAVLYFYLLWKYPFEIYKNKHTQMVKILILIVIVFSVFDPFSQELSVALYLFFPYVIFIADEHDTKQLTLEKTFKNC